MQAHIILQLQNLSLNSYALEFTVKSPFLPFGYKIQALF